MTINQVTLLAALGLVIVLILAKQQRRDEEQLTLINFEDIPSRIGPI